MNSTDNTLHVYFNLYQKTRKFQALVKALQSNASSYVFYIIWWFFYGLKCLWEDMVYRKDKIYLNTQDSRKIFCENEQKSTFHLRLILRKIFFWKGLLNLKRNRERVTLFNISNSCFVNYKFSTASKISCLYSDLNCIN